eukprot:GILI01023217.1.p1 GENE.GILI01023217.1~~GILI01023217.1.p1  ORF type:complete len:253 (-),score=34.21 GILI01023217.1:129-887(-)
MSSFSVSAAEFVPMAMRPAQPASQDPISLFNSQMSNAGQEASSAKSLYTTKATVCTPYFRQGTCNDPACRFAHCFSELDSTSQELLLQMAGGEEFLPIHFTKAAYQNQQRLFSGTGTPSGNKAPVTHFASARGMPTLGSSAHVTWEDVRVTLPSRCYYPHAIAGTYYDYLNVKRLCAPKDIEASYRSWRSAGYKAAKAIDQGKADSMDRLVVEAKLVLGNPTMRAEYDTQLPLDEGTMVPLASRVGEEDNIW